MSLKIGLFTLLKRRIAFQVFAVEAQLLQNILRKLEQNYIVVGSKKNVNVSPCLEGYCILYADCMTQYQ